MQDHGGYVMNDSAVIPSSGVNASLPMEAEVVEFVQESSSIFTLRLKLVDGEAQARYSFQPGQFNMLYLYGVGEVAISIVSDPLDETMIDHTIRAVGRVTNGLFKLREGDRLGLRGPYGRGWPMSAAEGRDVMIVTGGLGCAPVMGAINYVLMRRNHFGRLTIIQGVKHSDELIWRARYDYWNTLPHTDVLIAAEHGGTLWPFHHGRVTEVLKRAKGDPANTIGMLCGPEGMLKAASEKLITMGVSASALYLSMERNMQCGVGHCGHCLYGAHFICKDGPVFPYPQVKHLFALRGV